MKVVEPRSIKELGYYKTKLYTRNVLSLPSAVKRALGVEEGDEIVFEVSPEGVRLRNPKSIEIKEIEPVSDEELRKAREEAWTFRQAYDKAEEFLQDVAEALRSTYKESDRFEVVREKNFVFLNLHRNLKLEYTESEEYPEGVLLVSVKGYDREETLKTLNTLNSFLGKGYVRSHGREGNPVLVIKENPEFSPGEAALIGILAEFIRRGLKASKRG